ncbi:hydroxypyruvate isomerase [Arboricoccus pini]|uniref:Hydroxypyruvate isomerase n=1 Tax=Arboricoccus pini TaxID=1963835 RepID=A0A212RNM0_9PROT|nr:2-oxo-tetronate isomerase [Arboricoccus pini]SNB74127.1 hydroxypyruvate isomerase [Arboricoccus pini]
MPRFAANLSMMFNEWDFLDRFAAAADAGFEAVEFLFPYDFPSHLVGERLHQAGLTQALFNLPPGDWSKGERGFAAIPARANEVAGAIAQALPYAKALGASRVHLMAGLADSADPKAIEAYGRAVANAAAMVGEHGLDLLIEPINPRDMPGYFLGSVDRAAALIEKLAIPNLKLQFDIYHCQIIHGDVTMRLRRYLPLIGHVQIASVPSRHEPDGEEVNYPFFFDELDRLDYRGFVGCEYRPRGATLDGLSWFEPYRPTGD